MLMAETARTRACSLASEYNGSASKSAPKLGRARSHSVYSVSSSSLDDLSHGDRLAKQSDVTVGGDAVPPETEYFGFALYVGSFVAFLGYILWAYLPRWMLQALGVYYFPSRWWALAVPAYIAVTMAYIYIALAAYNTEVLTKPASELRNVTDPVARVVPSRRRVPAYENVPSRRNSTIEETLGSEDEHGELAFPSIARKTRGRASTPQTPTTTSVATSPFGSPHGSTTNLPGLASSPPLPIQSPLPKMPLDHYLFNPSDGVWDLPLSEVCNVLYNKP